MTITELHEQDLLFNPALTPENQASDRDSLFSGSFETDIDYTHENIQWVQIVYSYRAAGFTDKQIGEYLSLSVKAAEAGLTLDDIRAFAGIS